MNDEQIFLDGNTGDDAFPVSVMCAGVCSLEEIQKEGSKGNSNNKRNVDTF